MHPDRQQQQQRQPGAVGPQDGDLGRPEEAHIQPQGHAAQVVCGGLGKPNEVLLTNSR